MCNCNCKDKHKPGHRRWLALIGSALLVVVLLAVIAGCESTLDMAPLPQDRLDAQKYTPADFAAFDAGRDIYLRQCSTCHSIEPIGDYSRVAWARIMPKMARLSKLTEEETGLVTDYVLTIRDAMDETP
jgi:mono/diheme cytochrome c family protein